MRTHDHDHDIFHSHIHHHLFHHGHPFRQARTSVPTSPFVTSTSTSTSTTTTTSTGVTAGTAPTSIRANPTGATVTTIV